MAPRRLFGLFCLAAITFISLYLAFGSDLKLRATQLNQIGIGVESRILWWDWKDTAEEQYCWADHELEGSKERIPNVIHFVLLGHEGRAAELKYAQFLAIKAAILRGGNAKIKLHTYALNTTNEWWAVLQKHVSLVEHAEDEFKGPHGLPLQSLQMAHQADIFRLNILAQEGGIYLDTDMYTLRPFTNLLSNPRDILMGHEGGNRYGLCNAVIIARPGSAFIQIWLSTYATFDPHGWNKHSVRIPKQLQVQYPELICPLSPSVFFWPTWAMAHVRFMYQPITTAEVASLKSNMSDYNGAMYANQLAIHGWAAHDQIDALTADNMQTHDTRFNVLLREIAAAPL